MNWYKIAAINNWSVESGRTGEDLELKPEFANKYKSVAVLQGNSVIEGRPGDNHATIAERLGFPKGLIPGFVDTNGDFVYQYTEDVPSVQNNKPKLAQNQGDEIFSYLGSQFNVTKAIAIASGKTAKYMVPSPSWNAMISINKEFVSQADLTKPIVFATMVDNSQDVFNIMIDGNHRVAKALSLNPVPAIPVVVLNVKETLQCIIHMHPKIMKNMKKHVKAKPAPDDNKV